MTDERYYVYVVKLRSLSGKPEVYVGSSSLRPEERLNHHKTGARGSKHVRRRGQGLLPRFYAHLNPFRSRREAHSAERQLRASLERKGFVVYGSCSPGESLGCSAKL